MTTFFLVLKKKRIKRNDLKDKIDSFFLCCLLRGKLTHNLRRYTFFFFTIFKFSNLFFVRFCMKPSSWKWYKSHVSFFLCFLFLWLIHSFVYAFKFSYEIRIWDMNAKYTFLCQYASYLCIKRHTFCHLISNEDIKISNRKIKIFYFSLRQLLVKTRFHSFEK